MKKVLFAICMLPIMAHGKSIVYNDNVKTLQVVVNDDWLSPPVMKLYGDVLHVAFDELSHDYHRYICRLEHCEYDWTTSDDIFESDWLEGFNDTPIEDYVNSLNTTVLYTHYKLCIPNERCKLKMSGNYRLHIIDEENDEEAVCVEFRVVEPVMTVGLAVTTNTDIDVNKSHQQVAMTVRYNAVKVNNPEGQIKAIVMQNAREDNMKRNVRPNHIVNDGLRWEHNQSLIFDAGNEYHKFEVLDVTHPTLGIERITWDGTNYQAYPFVSTPRLNYLYDEDANGAFIVRNSDNIEIENTCDYVYVNYKLQPVQPYEGADVVVDGQWTTGKDEYYRMTYHEENRSYSARILQKQGYYSYQFLLRDANGITHVLPEEGSFFETENRYQAMVYFKGTGDRSWRLVGYQQTTFR